MNNKKNKKYYVSLTGYKSNGAMERSLLIISALSLGTRVNYSFLIYDLKTNLVGSSVLINFVKLSLESLRLTSEALKF